jgi:hypothetical protein
MDEARVSFPICVDGEPSRTADPFGPLFTEFAVPSVPHAVVVDADGVIAARGRLKDVVEKANALTKTRD